ncbi:hypothetical protein H5410_027509 [Solanum commersonii]|uniref:Uncharacterized protein n=1 Tax=Solanum commersonii TaxID=4109 RepID=A0A9J5YZD7_SOLCO|nr:hypothetical protein H5410_027509 [Solanum commersonii]
MARMVMRSLRHPNERGDLVVLGVKIVVRREAVVVPGRRIPRSESKVGSTLDLTESPHLSSRGGVWFQTPVERGEYAMLMSCTDEHIELSMWLRALTARAQRRNYRGALYHRANSDIAHELGLTSPPRKERRLPSPSLTSTGVKPKYLKTLALPEKEVATSGMASSQSVAGGVYKAGNEFTVVWLTGRLLAIRLHASELRPQSDRGRVLGLAHPRGIATLCPGHCSTVPNSTMATKHEGCAGDLSQHLTAAVAAAMHHCVRIPRRHLSFKRIRRHVKPRVSYKDQDGRYAAPSIHHLRLGLLGLSSRCRRPRVLSPLVLFSISTHFTAPPEIPSALPYSGLVVSTALSRVEPQDLWPDLKATSEALSRPIIRIALASFVLPLTHELADAYSRIPSLLLLRKRSSRPVGLLPPRGIARRALSPLRKIPRRLRRVRAMSRSLDHNLGKLLPHQLANRDLSPSSGGFLLCSSTYGVLAAVSMLFPPKGGSYALLTRPPLETPFPMFPVRLACVKHAASVHPEPGSNSP